VVFEMRQILEFIWIWGRYKVEKPDVWKGRISAVPNQDSQRKSMRFFTDHLRLKRSMRVD